MRSPSNTCLLILRKQNTYTHKVELKTLYFNFDSPLQKRFLRSISRKRLIIEVSALDEHIVLSHKYTIVFGVVVALLGAFSFNAILRSHFHRLLLMIFNIRRTLLIITLVIGSIFYILVAFFLFY